MYSYVYLYSSCGIAPHFFSVQMLLVGALIHEDMFYSFPIYVLCICRFLWCLSDFLFSICTFHGVTWIINLKHSLLSTSQFIIQLIFLECILQSALQEPLDVLCTVSVEWLPQHACFTSGEVSMLNVSIATLSLCNGTFF